MEQVLKNPPRVFLAGIGGYGTLYAETLLRMRKDGEIVIAGMADPYPDSCEKLAEIKEEGIPLYDSASRFWNEGGQASLTMIASPIAFHTRQTLEALSHGSSVLCEKPLSGDYRDGGVIEELALKNGKFVMSGYQWSYSKAVTDLKADILAGVWGKPVRLKTLVLWPRPVSYFKRGSGWAGRKYDPDGTPVMDSVVNNAAAHYLHNMLYVLGDRFDTALMPESVTAQLSRANDIENFDSAAIRCRFGSGAEALFFASHCTDRVYNPSFVYRFENGTVTFNEDNTGGKTIAGTLDDGRVILYGDPYEDSSLKIRLAVKNITAAEPYLPCTAKTAVPHAAVVAAVQKTGIRDVPDRLKSAGSSDTVTVPGLYEAMTACYREDLLPAEAGRGGMLFAPPETVRPG